MYQRVLRQMKMIPLTMPARFLSTWRCQEPNQSPGTPCGHTNLHEEPDTEIFDPIQGSQTNAEALASRSECVESGIPRPLRPQIQPRDSLRVITSIAIPVLLGALSVHWIRHMDNTTTFYHGYYGTMYQLLGARSSFTTVRPIPPPPPPPSAHVPAD
ncbi:hypothetical protein BJ742DRAFT_20638 [Cladochytrium replicatum]|nr:hypothetical protein BJ742DRAFT_20638 [Cladochytrium replicatum]